MYVNLHTKRSHTKFWQSEKQVKYPDLFEVSIYDFLWLSENNYAIAWIKDFNYTIETNINLRNFSRP